MEKKISAIENTANASKTDVKTLSLFMDIGVMMIKNGSEVKRVEDTLRRMGHAYGAMRMDVFAITSTLVCTMTIHGGAVCTMTRSTAGGGTTNFSRLEKINALSRQYCSQPLSLEELENAIIEIKKSPPSKLIVCTGNVLAAGTLAVFFGGNVTDGIAASVFAILIWLMKEYFSPICTNSILFNFICSFVTGVIIGFSGKLVPIHGDKVMIGDIMLLIPGLALTNGVKDMFVGDTITGSLRLVESVLSAAAIAFGFALSMYITM